MANREERLTQTKALEVFEAECRGLGLHIQKPHGHEKHLTFRYLGKGQDSKFVLGKTH